MKRGPACGGDEAVMRETSQTGGRRSPVSVLAGATMGALLVGSMMMPTTAAAEEQVIVEASVTAPSVSGSANCFDSDSWSATWVISSNAGDTGSWQLNGGAFQSTAVNFVVEETLSLSGPSAKFAATVSFDGGAQARPVAATVDRPTACISAPPPPAPEVEAEASSHLSDSSESAEAVSAPSVVASSNCAGADAWLATWVISSNAGKSGTWQLNGGAFQSTDTAFVVEETHAMHEASAALAANVSYEGGPQAVPVAGSADRPTACISAPPPPGPPAETVAVVEVFGPAAVASPTVGATPSPDLAQTLPETGNETTILALLALASLGAGMLLLRASRRGAVE